MYFIDYVKRTFLMWLTDSICVCERCRWVVVTMHPFSTIRCLRGNESDRFLLYAMLTPLVVHHVLVLFFFFCSFRIHRWQSNDGGEKPIGDSPMFRPYQAHQATHGFCRSFAHFLLPLFIN